jgi:hypothetical protein
MSRSYRLALVLVPITLQALSAQAEPWEDVLFETRVQVPAGESAFVLGDLRELGGGDLRRAVGMVRGADGAWHATIRLPAGREYSYQILSRKPGSLLCSAANGTPLSGRVVAGTGPVALSPARKVIFYRGKLAQPVLSWRQGAGDLQSAAMLPAGEGREPGEATWRAVLGLAGRPVELFLTDGAGAREPTSGVLSTLLDTAYVQDGELFSYAPAPHVSPPRRDYDPASPPAIDSAILGYGRGYRVLLPPGDSPALAADSFHGAPAAMVPRSPTAMSLRQLRAWVLMGRVLMASMAYTATCSPAWRGKSV